MPASALARRTALITGAARGIGRAIAEDLSQDHNVAVCHHTSRPDWAGPGILTVRGDLTAPDAAKEAVEEVLQRFGRLDVIVNNAGLVENSPLDVFDQDAFRSIFDLNTLAPHAILAASLPHLETGAAVVNISSVNAQLPPMGASLYGASKAALELWTRGAAKELGPRGIRVNAVAPGAIDVEDAPRPEELKDAFRQMTALGRMGTPEDIAAAVRFLVSDAAAFITGEVLVVSGGYRL